MVEKRMINQGGIKLYVCREFGFQLARELENRESVEYKCIGFSDTQFLVVKESDWRQFEIDSYSYGFDIARVEGGCASIDPINGPVSFHNGRMVCVATFNLGILDGEICGPLNELTFNISSSSGYPRQYKVKLEVSTVTVENRSTCRIVSVSPTPTMDHLCEICITASEQLSQIYNKTIIVEISADTRRKTDG